MGEDQINVIMVKLDHLEKKIDNLHGSHEKCRTHCDAEMPVVHGRITDMGKQLTALHTRCELVQDGKVLDKKVLPHWVHTAIIAISIIIGILISVKVH